MWYIKLMDIVNKTRSTDLGVFMNKMQHAVGNQ